MDGNFWAVDFVFMDVSTIVCTLQYVYNVVSVHRFSLVPLFLDTCKDAYHSCSHCKADLGVYRRFKEI